MKTSVRFGPTGSEAPRTRLAMRKPEPGDDDDRGSGPSARCRNFGEEDPTVKRRERKGKKAKRRDKAGIRVSQGGYEQCLSQHD